MAQKEREIDARSKELHKKDEAEKKKSPRGDKAIGWQDYVRVLDNDVEK